MKGFKEPNGALIAPTKSIEIPNPQDTSRDYETIGCHFIETVDFVSFAWWEYLLPMFACSVDRIPYHYSGRPSRPPSPSVGSRGSTKRGTYPSIALAVYVPFLTLQCSPDVWSHMAGITEMLLRDFRLEFDRDGFA